MKDKVQINIVQFDVAARVGSETEKILDRIGMRRNVVTNIQLMILSLNSWLYKNAIQKAVVERNEGRGVEALQWANKMLAEYWASSLIQMNPKSKYDRPMFNHYLHLPICI